MFGKRKKSPIDNFITERGRAVGNLKGAGRAFNEKQALKTDAGGKVGKKQGAYPYGERPISRGKAGPVKLTGD